MKALDFAILEQMKTLTEKDLIMHSWNPKKIEVLDHSH